MTAADIEKEVRAISARLKAIDSDTPEMTSMDWASDHGWISQEEWEAAGEKSQAGVKLQDAEVEKVEALRREHPRAMDEFIGAHIDRLSAARDHLETLSRAAKDNGLEFAMSFNLALLPDIIANLRAWRDKTKPKHWPSWMWRVAFSVVEESENFVKRQSGNHDEAKHG